MEKCHPGQVPLQGNQACFHLFFKQPFSLIGEIGLNGSLSLFLSKAAIHFCFLLFSLVILFAETVNKQGLGYVSVYRVELHVLCESLQCKHLFCRWLGVRRSRGHQEVWCSLPSPCPAPRKHLMAFSFRKGDDVSQLHEAFMCLDVEVLQERALGTVFHPLLPPSEQIRAEGWSRSRAQP